MSLSITRKILIALGTGVAFLVAMIVVLLGVAFYLGSDKELARETEAKKVEGREFGKTTNQEGCLKEGLTRAKTTTIFNLKANEINRAFVGACLESSHPTPRFCDGVPRDSLLNPSAEADWEKQQCENVGMDHAQTGCDAVFTAKANFCNGD